MQYIHPFSLPSQFGESHRSMCLCFSLKGKLTFARLYSRRNSNREFGAQSGQGDHEVLSTRARLSPTGRIQSRPQLLPVQLVRVKGQSSEDSRASQSRFRPELLVSQGDKEKKLQQQTWSFIPHNPINQPWSLCAYSRYQRATAFFSGSPLVHLSSRTPYSA